MPVPLFSQNPYHITHLIRAMHTPSAHLLLLLLVIGAYGGLSDLLGVESFSPQLLVEPGCVVTTLSMYHTITV